MMIDLVECHSGATYAERPTALYWEGRRLLVEEVLASWREPGLARFRVRTEDNQAFDLAYDEANDTWLVSQS
jgi:hypothetical protein